MRLIEKISKLAEIGVNKNYLDWEKHLTRKLNYIALIGILNIGLAIIVYALQDNYLFIIELLTAFIIWPFLLLLNKWFNYNYSLYLFYILSLTLVLLFSFKMGADSEIYLFFFPIAISMVLLLNKNENFKNLIVLFFILLFFIFCYLMNVKFNWFQGVLSPNQLANIKVTNIFFSSFVILLFAIILSRQNIKQQNEMHNLILEKDTLLAEVHHRVKNNMAIISSLMNLKKAQCITTEAKEALEDCQNRVYSMALIHQKVYNSKFVTAVNFGDYLVDLTNELVFSYSEKDRVKLHINAENCLLSLDVAVPCGLIVNELITNSIKHAMPKDKPLELILNMTKKGNEYSLTIKDNGPGLQENPSKKDTLGLSLIATLSNQLDGKYSFNNSNGLEFTLLFDVVA